MTINTKRVWIPILLGVVCAIYALFIRKCFNIVTVCPFRGVLHVYCITCGATRMAESLLHLQIYKALRYNAFILITSPYILLVICVASGVVVIKEENYKKYYVSLVVFVVGAVAFMVARNTIMPFLAPTEIW